MHRVFLVLTVLLVVLLLGSYSPKKYDDAVATMDSIAGSWRPVVDRRALTTYRAGKWALPSLRFKWWRGLSVQRHCRCRNSVSAPPLHDDLAVYLERGTRHETTGVERGVVVATSSGVVADHHQITDHSP